MADSEEIKENDKDTFNGKINIKDKDSNYLITYTRHLERRLRALESTKNKVEHDLTVAQRELSGSAKN